MAEPYESHPHDPYQTRSDHDVAGTAPTPSGQAVDAAKDVAATTAEQAGAVRDSAAQATSDVVENVKEEAGAVIDEVKQHGRRLYAESMAELRTQAETGQTRLADLVRSLTGELQSMVDAGDQNGPMTQVAATLQDAGDRAASWLESRGPADAVADVRRYAARNPMAFLAAAAGIGFLGARLARALRDDHPGPASQPRLADERAFGLEPTPTAPTPAQPYDPPAGFGNLEDPNR